MEFLVVRKIQIEDADDTRTVHDLNPIKHFLVLFEPSIPKFLR